MEWIPIVFIIFKALVLGIGMFYAIKWHYDQGKKDPDKKAESRALLRASAKVAAIFLVLLLVLGGVTYVVIGMLDA